MTRHTRLVLLVPMAVAAFSGAARAADSNQVPVVRIHSRTEIAAPPSAVWAQLTEGKNFATWCPMWKSAANGKTALTKVGDSVDFTDQWKNGGRSVVTYLVRNKELRIAHEPNDGSYMCQAKVVLAPAGAGTIVDWWDQYTDESKPEDMKATMTKASADQDASLAALKKAAEGK